MKLFIFTAVALTLMSSCASDEETNENQGLVFNTSTDDTIVMELVAVPKSEYENQNEDAVGIPEGAILRKIAPKVEKEKLPEPEYDLSRLKKVLASMKLPGDLSTYLESLEIKYMPLEHSALAKEVAGYSYGDYSQTQITDDFDGDNRDDYALIMNSRGTVVSIVVFLRRGNSYTHRVLDVQDYGKIYDETSIQVIMIRKTKKVVGVDGPLELENTGIYVSCNLCPVGSVYYWADGDFVSYAISD